MAFGRTLARRLFGMSSRSRSQIQAAPAMSRRTACELAAPKEAAPRFLPWATVMPEMREKLKEINGEWLRRDVGVPSPFKPEEVRVSAEDAKRMILAARAVAARERLKGDRRGCVTHNDFVDMVGSSEVAEMVEKSGDVLSIGDLVFLHPSQVIKAMENAIPAAFQPAVNEADPRWAELEEMKKTKAEIDKKAAAQVKIELWAGLGFLMAQTAGFMRLTFWELSWDVMEPICFYVTSIYFMAGYAFFLRTAREPCFEGLFQARLQSRQSKLMKLFNFDNKRFEELCQELNARDRNNQR